MNFRVASVVLAVLAMAESALQKIIVMTLIYGKSVWLALDQLFQGISKEFAVHADVSFSLLLIGIYLVVYLIWGLVVGLFSGSLPFADRRPQKRDTGLVYSKPGKYGIPCSGGRRKKYRLGIYLLVLAFIVAVFLPGGNNKQQVLFILFLERGCRIAAVFCIAPAS